MGSAMNERIRIALFDELSGKWSIAGLNEN
jgi:hypothetical protein